MGEQSAEEAYRALVHWLRENDLSWVAEQVEDEIKLGKVKQERIKVTSDMFSVPEPLARLPSGRQSSADFVGRAEYTAQEKFEMVVGAVHATIIGAVRIQDALAETLGAYDRSMAIRFVPGETGETQHEYVPADLDHRRAAAEKVEALLSELRKEVKNAD
jgi:hypothetical protein